VILASFVIVFALSFANILAIVPTSPKYEATELEKLGYNVLYDLDKQGLLPRFVYNGEWENLTAALRVSLPLDVYFNMTIYYVNGTKVAHQQIFYGDITTFAISKNVASVTYGLAGHLIKINATQYEANYDPRILILQLTRG
jgi:hypothetical protein